VTSGKRIRKQKQAVTCHPRVSDRHRSDSERHRMWVADNHQGHQLGDWP